MKLEQHILLAMLVAGGLAACGESSKPTSQTASAASANNTPATATATKTAELNVYNWSDYVDPNTVTEFEKNNGVKMRQDFYDSNEILEAKVLTGNRATIWCSPV